MLKIYDSKQIINDFSQPIKGTSEQESFNVEKILIVNFLLWYKMNSMKIHF